MFSTTFYIKYLKYLVIVQPSVEVLNFVYYIDTYSTIANYVQSLKFFTSLFSFHLVLNIYNKNNIIAINLITIKGRISTNNLKNLKKEKLFILNNKGEKYIYYL